MSGATLRCRVCSARNPRDAAWCTQCYTPFAPEAPIDDVNAGDADGSSTTTAAAVDPDLRDQTAPLFTDPEHGRTEPLFSRSDHDQTLPVSDHDQTEPLFPSPERAPTRAPGRPSEPAVVQVGQVRDVAGSVEWRCSVCDGWVAVEASTCPRCGSPPSGFGAERADRRVADVDQGRVRALGALVPGGGHLVAGRAGSGFTRLILSVFWLVGGVWWLATTAAGGTLPGVILLVGVVVLWVMSYADAVSIATGRDERFGPRGLLWSVVGVTGLLMLTVAVLAARGSVR